MKTVDIRVIGGKINISDYVGVKTSIDGISIEITNYSSKYEELTIAIDGNRNGTYMSIERISLGLGIESLINRLKFNYQIETNIIDGEIISANSINMMDNMIKVGCSDLVVENESIFATNEGMSFKIPCDFLEEKERQFLMNKIRKARTKTKIISIIN